MENKNIAKYAELVNHFSGNEKLRDLINYAIIDLERQKREHRLIHGVYPQEISLVDKILEDFRISEFNKRK